MAIGVGIGLPFSKSGGGATPFAMGNSLYTDGVNDVVQNSVLSSTAFNPYQTSAWSASVWVKPTTAATMNLFAVSETLGGTDRFWLRLYSNNQLGCGSHGQIAYSGVTFPSSYWTSWNMYSVSVRVDSATTQTVFFYINGALFATIAKGKYSYTPTSIQLSLAAFSYAGGGLQGYSTQYVFTENLVPESEWLALYNSGSGADPSVVITSPHSIYNINESAGTTSGDIVDALGEQDLTMFGFVAPFGVNAEAP
jgi:hypothetical protein